MTKEDNNTKEEVFWKYVRTNFRLPLLVTSERVRARGHKHGILSKEIQRWRR